MCDGGGRDGEGEKGNRIDEGLLEMERRLRIHTKESKIIDSIFKL